MAQPRFSIITVCRNNAKTIGRTISSVNAQVGVNIEHIFIDGASNDETVPIIASNASSKSIVVSEPDSGIYDAMNKGLARVTGDFVGILNADDHYINNDVLNHVAQTFQQRECRCVFGDVEFFNPESPEIIVRRYNSGIFSPKRLVMGIMPAHPATFFRREIYEKFGNFKTSYKIAADFEFIARTLGDERVTYVHVPQVFVKMQSGGVSSRGLRSKLVLNREILRALRENELTSSPFLLAAKLPLRLLEFMR
jgi:glycosyltransferase involved in cell wall biosynthesis